jgi:hypothetical protein
MTSKKDTKPTLLDHARQERRDYGGNSIWDWSNFHLAGRLGEIEEEYMNEAILDDPIIVECWKYKNEDAQSGFALSYDEVKYIKEEDIPAWLAQSPQSNRRPCAGLRLIHQFQGFKNCRTLAAISDKFGVPDVFSHLTSANTGSCGKFMSEDARSGMSFQD